jgi:ABC-type branched-subunit amino acid transport system substrate-binding protein
MFLWLPLAPAKADNGVTAQQLLIGQTITLQGGKNDYGVAVQEGITAVIRDTNARGGVNRRLLRLVTLDDDNRNEQAEANARTLITRDKVFMLFGSIEGGPSSAVAKVAAEASVPFFGPMAGSPILRRPHQPWVFPVRAEHREEFRSLLQHAKSIGETRVAFVRSDSQTGRDHLENVKLLCRELGLELVLDLPFKSDVTDAQLAEMADRIGKAKVQTVFNHGGIGVYARLVRAGRAQGLRTSFNAVNSGAAQLAKQLGDLAPGMVFSQVMPSPWERKWAVTREYQELFAKTWPGHEFSYGSLEGFVTARALVEALRAAGPNPTRAGFAQGLYANGGLDIDGLVLTYQPGVHAGMGLVDLSIVTREGRFRH